MAMTIGETVDHIQALHRDQFDLSGQPYWTHPVRVMARLPGGLSDSVYLAALLHDTMEDCGQSLHSLSGLGFDLETINLISWVTRPPHDATPYQEWIEYIAAKAPIGALFIKLADVQDNSDSRRLAILNYETRAKLIDKYQAAEHTLIEAINKRLMIKVG